MKNVLGEAAHFCLNQTYVRLRLVGVNVVSLFPLFEPVRKLLIVPAEVDLFVMKCVHMSLSSSFGFIPFHFYFISIFLVCACTQHVLISEAGLSLYPGFEKPGFTPWRIQNTVACVHLTADTDNC